VGAAAGAPPDTAMPGLSSPDSQVQVIRLLCGRWRFPSGFPPQDFEHDHTAGRAPAFDGLAPILHGLFDRIDYFLLRLTLDAITFSHKPPCNRLGSIIALVYNPVSLRGRGAERQLGKPAPQPPLPRQISCCQSIVYTLRSRKEPAHLADGTAVDPPVPKSPCPRDCTRSIPPHRTKPCALSQ
jgi:hypothetical protein